MNKVIASLMAVFCFAAFAAFSSDSSPLKSESFDHDPGWDGYNNRPAPGSARTVRQQFGYSQTNHSGKAAGEIGGRVQRSTLPAYYADAIETRTLNDKLSASGSFAIVDHEGTNGSLLFGWFNSNQAGGGRPMPSFGMEIGCSRPGAHMHLRLINASNQSCGTPITPDPRPKVRGPEGAAITNPIRKDGTRYTWKLDYDPEADNGNGLVTFSIHSNLDKHEAWENQEFTVHVPMGFKQAGGDFDRFGIIDIMKTGGAVTIYFDDLTYDGRNEDFSQDPHWTSLGNSGTFQETNSAGMHDFGFSPDTNNAGKQPGEAGGIFWRNEKGGNYYGDRVSSLSLEDRLEARGKIKLLVGAPDSGVRFGWFNSADRKETSGSRDANFVGAMIGGPTRVGHYFGPEYLTAKGTRGHTDTAPVLTPGKPFDFSMIYDPADGNGKGAIQVQLGDTSATLLLKSEARYEGATFDRFGFETTGPGGQMVKLFVDDLEYTARRAKSANQQ